MKCCSPYISSDFVVVCNHSFSRADLEDTVLRVKITHAESLNSLEGKRVVQVRVECVRYQQKFLHLIKVAGIQTIVQTMDFTYFKIRQLHARIGRSDQDNVRVDTNHEN